MALKISSKFWEREKERERERERERSTDVFFKDIM